MLRQLSLFLGSAALVTALVLTPAEAHGPGGGGGHGGGHHAGGYHGGGYHYGGYYYPHYGHAFYGPYRPGLYAPYGFYRPYYGGFYGPGLGLGGLGLFGLGFGMGYGLGGYGLGGYGLYLPYYGGTTIVNPTTVVTAPPAGGTGVAPVAQTPPPPDNAAHLQLVVPQNAEVLFNGDTTTQTGTVREFVSPPLTPGKSYDYAITVRYLDADGKSISDRRVIHVHANDWFRIDFTRPAPPEPVPAP
jgi:uncharacterized protein (TIGR03000 family)